MTDFKHFTIVHQLKKRIRIIAPNLLKDQERSYIFQILLLKRDGIESVKVVASIASVTIYFDPQQLPKQNLLILLDSVLYNVGLKPRDTISALKRSALAHQLPAKDIVFGISGMSCSSCALFLEMVLQRNPEINRASVNYVSEIARINSYLSKEALFKLVAKSGYQAFSIDTLSERKLLLDLEQKHLNHSKRRLKDVGILSVPVMLLSMLPYKSRLLYGLQALLSVPVVILGGQTIFKRAYIQAKQGIANMDSLIAIGAGSALAYSLPAIFIKRQHVYFEVATGIIEFILIGRYLEELAKNKMVKDIRQLVDLQPRIATKLQGKKEVSIAAAEVLIDDILLIRSGEKVAADGVVIKGLSSVDESSITGSAIPCIKEAGSQLLAGSINGSGVLQMRTTAVAKETVLSGLIQMVDEAQSSKLQIQKTVDRLAAVFVPATLGLSALTMGGWLLAGQKVAHSFANAISVLLISCPCALGLATPAATKVGTGKAARQGIYIRNSHALEAMPDIDTIIFDKTGTITEGNASVVSAYNISNLADQEVFQIAASAEFNSEHFLAKAIVAYAQQHNLELLESSQFYSTPDQGVRVKVGQQQVLLGSKSWMQDQKVDVQTLDDYAQTHAEQGEILVYMAIEGEAAALFIITDQIREDAKAVIEYLHQKNIDTIMVSGDTESSCLYTAKQLGIHRYIAEANPAKKLHIIRDLQNQGYQVAMVGDGINDAPALAAANVSLAVGSGTDIAIESADLILAQGEIAKVAESFEISEKTLQKIKQNLFWAFAYNTVAIPIAVTGKLNPLIATAAMALSSVSVIVNSLRLDK